MQDLRDDIFRNLKGRVTDAIIIADSDGIIAGTDRANQVAQQLSLTVTHIAKEGSCVRGGDIITAVQGDVKQVIIGEERLMGCISKPSGVATSAHKFIRAAAGKPRIVSGAWKKMPMELKEAIRAAVLTGGALGSFMGSFKFAPKLMEIILGIIILVAILFLAKKVISI